MPSARKNSEKIRAHKEGGNKGIGNEQKQGGRDWSIANIIQYYFQEVASKKVGIDVTGLCFCFLLTTRKQTMTNEST